MFTSLLAILNHPVILAANHQTGISDPWLEAIVYGPAIGLSVSIGLMIGSFIPGTPVPKHKDFVSRHIKPFAIFAILATSITTIGILIHSFVYYL